MPGAHEISHAGATTMLRLELFVRDPARSQQFYEQTLGFELDPDAYPPEPDYIAIRKGTVRIGLTLLDGLGEDHYFQPANEGRLGVGVEIVLEVSDLHAHERVARGLSEIAEPLQLREWGLWDFRVVDPDGYYIRLTERPG